MKKTNIFAVAFLGVGSLLAATSCNSNTTGGNDSDSLAVETTTPYDGVNVPNDSIAKIFADPAKKSEVATDSTYAQTASGLKYMIVKEGKGDSPKPTDVVKVHYEGKLLDGTVFDSSYSRGEPASFPLNQVIPGWTEGLQLMKEGGKAVFYIPSNLAYGPQGAGPIPPNSDLIFTVELLDVD